MKSLSLTGELRLILDGLSLGEGRGIPGVAVKCVDIWRNTGAKAASWTNTDTDERKPGEQTGLDTPVVLALNDECLVWRVSIPAVPKLTH